MCVMGYVTLRCKVHVCSFIVYQDNFKNNHSIKKNYITSSFKWMTYFSLLNSIALEMTSCGGTYRVVNMSVHECLHVFVYTCMRWGFLCMVDEFYSV